MMKKVCWLFIMGLFLIGCSNQENNKIEDVDCLCPHATVYLQPYDNFTQKEANQLKKELEKHLVEILDGAFEIEVLPNKQLTSDFLGETKTKYRIDKIISSLKKDADTHKIYIGLTHKDICREEKNGVKDWGVLGSSIITSHACVVSTYRLKNKKRDLWKLATHEFIHTYYGYHHCPKDDIHCLMKDAKGKADFSNKKDLCDFCKSKIG